MAYDKSEHLKDIYAMIRGIFDKEDLELLRDYIIKLIAEKQEKGKPNVSTEKL